LRRKAYGVSIVVRTSRESQRPLEKEDYQAAFILNAPKKDEILTIVSAGEKMPQKSTYFYPKLLSGLIVNKIEPREEIQDQKEV
jgi:uncharacterized protein (DUF1015 family)